jgi:hypothetical protein
VEELQKWISAHLPRQEDPQDFHDQVLHGQVSYDQNFHGQGFGVQERISIPHDCTSIRSEDYNWKFPTTNEAGKFWFELEHKEMSYNPNSFRISLHAELGKDVTGRVAYCAVDDKDEEVRIFCYFYDNFVIFQKTMHISRTA